MERFRKLKNLRLRKLRIRHRLSGTSERPRLSVFISNRHVSAQIIDDSTQRTLAASSSVGRKALPINLSERASWVGSDIAKKAKAVKISRVVFDRNGRQYHGRIAALASAAREAGLEF